MSVKYDLYRTPQPKKGKKKAEVKYHARVVGGQTLDENLLAKYIHNRCTLSEGDFLTCMYELGQEMATQLCAGNRVYLPHIGYFSITLDAPEGCNPEDTHAQSVKFKQIKFRADQQLKDLMLQNMHLERAEVKVHSKAMSLEAIDQKLIEYFQKKRVMNRATFQELCKMTTSSSYRHINRLVEEGKLVNINTPHSPLYEKGDALAEKSDALAAIEKG